MALTPILPVLFLLSGYSFLTTWNISKWRSAREQGHRLYFRIVFYGIFTLICSYLLLMIYSPLDVEAIRKSTSNLDKISYSDFLPFFKLQMLALLLGLSLGHIYNHLLRIPFLNYFHNLAFRHIIRNNDFELLLWTAIDKQSPISITTESNRVYVGYVIRTLEPHKTRTHLRILPILSGYRDDHQRVHFTSNYSKLFKDLDINDASNKQKQDLTTEDFELIIPSTEIKTSTLFDIESFIHFKKLEKLSYKRANIPFKYRNRYSSTSS